MVNHPSAECLSVMPRWLQQMRMRAGKSQLELPAYLYQWFVVNVRPVRSVEVSFSLSVMYGTEIVLNPQCWPVDYPLRNGPRCTLNGRLLALTLLLTMGLGKPVTTGTFPPPKLTTLAFEMPIWGSFWSLEFLGVHNTGHLSFGKIPSSPGNFMPLRHQPVSPLVHRLNSKEFQAGEQLRVGIWLPRAGSHLVQVWYLWASGAFAI